MGQFGIGQSVRRKEDVRFLTGQGQFLDDVNRPGQAYAYLLRSPHAHARILKIDVAAAKRSPGVLGVYTGADVKAAGLGGISCTVPLKNKDGSDYFSTVRPLLADGKVRQVGDPVALIVATGLEQAKDAAEQIEVDYEPLPVVVDAAAAVEPGAPQIWEGARNNVALDWGLGDPKAVEAAFAKAAHITRLDLFCNRVVVNSLEGRGVLGEYDVASGRYTVHIGSQGVFNVRRNLAKALGVPESQIKVVTPDVGGAFGMKGFEYPENALMPWAAKLLGRPVKWISERQEAFLSDTQGREQVMHVELALDKEGKFLAIRAETIANVGAYLSTFSLIIPTIAGFRLLTGAYRIPAAYVNVRCAFTNTVWVDAYRGAGRPETAYLLERVVDEAARELNIPREEIRRRNFVPASAMPYATPLIAVYDSGDFRRNLDDATRLSDWAGFEKRRAEAKAQGKLRGIGMCYYMEVTANAPVEAAEVRFRADGGVDLLIGTGPSGQGHETAFPQILGDLLGIPMEQIQFRGGDSDMLKTGGGTGGAKSLMLAGTATYDAAQKIIAKGRMLAGHLLEAAESDIEFKDGIFSIVGTDRRIGILDLAAKARDPASLPPGVPPGLDDTGNSTSNKNTYPNGCHVCELEVEPATGEVSFARYTVVDDFGKVINPMLVEGQILGGIAQGASQALQEHTVFDPETGQLLSGSFMDYALARFDTVPVVELKFNEVPCTTNVLGIKGAGEAGCVGSLAAIMNALLDALRPVGVTRLDMPATPERVWQAIQAARKPA